MKNILILVDYSKKPKVINKYSQTLFIDSEQEINEQLTLFCEYESYLKLQTVTNNI
jgi:hypothetical protein